METKTKQSKPAVAASKNNQWKPIRLAFCTRTGRVVHLDDVRNANA